MRFATITPQRLAAFGDRIVLRDPRARSRTPSLVRTPSGLEIRGPFQIRRRIMPTHERGVRFTEATGDPNPIHRTGEVVPGAFLAAQVVSAVEILIPTLRPADFRVTFSGVAWYGRALRVTLDVTPTEDGLRFDARLRQDEREVATASLSGRVEATIPRLELPLDRVDGAWLMRVVDFYGSLGIDAETYFHKEACPDLSYPIAFLASLPSGSMVRRFQGEGGLLNRLSLEFSAAKLPIVGPPEVSLELPKRLRRSFNRILTAVKDGVQTAVRGTALVLPRPDADVLESLERP